MLAVHLRIQRAGPFLTSVQLPSLKGVFFDLWDVPVNLRWPRDSNTLICGALLGIPTFLDRLRVPDTCTLTHIL